MELKDNTSNSSVNTTATSSAIASSLVRTLFEPADIYILPQHRLKIAKTNLIPAICFYNGSLVPIHAGHLSVLQDAKQYIDNLGTHELLAAYMSPSHSGYIKKKLRPEEWIGAGHRLSMIYLAIESFDWVMVDLFEMFQPCKASLSIVMEAFISRVHSQLPNGERIDVFWLKGEDALFHTKAPDKMIRLGVQATYVVNRGCSENTINTNNQFKSIQDYHEKLWQDLRASSSFPERFHLVQATHMNLSSTIIRTCAHNPSVTLDQLQSCTQIDSVATYIFQHHLWSTLVNALPIAIPAPFVFPREIADVTPELLSYMLSANSGSSIKVISFLFEQIGIGKGWCGSLFRLYDIQYSSDSTDCSLQCVVLKLSTGIWMGRVASIEPEFYFKLGPLISNVEIPKCYYAARHPHSPDESLLLLEDLSLNYDSLGTKHSLKDSTVFFLIASIASLHAEFFKHPMLQQETFTWLPSLNSSLTHYHTEYAVKLADEKYIQLLESKVSPKAYAYAKALLAHLPHIFQTLSDEQYTLSHGDFWINNVFVRRDQPHRLVLFDWQTCCRANGLIDVVFHLRLLGSVRARSLEPQILDLYHQVLVKYGVSQYDAAMIREDYYSLALPFMLVVLSSFKVLKESQYNEIPMILEDIVTYGRRTERMTCDCELGL